MALLTEHKPQLRPTGQAAAEGEQRTREEAAIQALSQRECCQVVGDIQEQRKNATLLRMSSEIPQP